MNIKRLAILTGTIGFGLTIPITMLWLLSAPTGSARAASYTVCPAGVPTCNDNNFQLPVEVGNKDGAPEFDYVPGFRSVVGDAGGKTMEDMGADAAAPPIYLPLICNVNFSCPDFFDDFSDPASGWKVVDNEDEFTEYLNGEYRVAPKTEGYVYYYPAPTCSRQDYVVEVDARWFNAPGGSYGILFGALADYNRYYTFEIDSVTQEFSVWRRIRTPSSWTELVQWDYSSAINSGNAPNHLKLTRQGFQFTLELNGVVLGSWSDGSLTGSTYAGVMTFPYYEQPAYDVRFDNFSVTGNY